MLYTLYIVLCYSIFFMPMLVTALMLDQGQIFNADSLIRQGSLNMISFLQDSRWQLVWSRNLKSRHILNLTCLSWPHVGSMVFQIAWSYFTRAKWKAQALVQRMSLEGSMAGLVHCPTSSTPVARKESGKTWKANGDVIWLDIVSSTLRSSIYGLWNVVGRWYSYVLLACCLSGGGEISSPLQQPTAPPGSDSALWADLASAGHQAWAAWLTFAKGSLAYNACKGAGCCNKSGNSCNSCNW